MPVETRNVTEGFVFISMGKEVLIKDGHRAGLDQHFADCQDNEAAELIASLLNARFESVPATNQAGEADVRVRLREAYDAVADWPEKRGDPMTVGGAGFMDLLKLRNLVAELLDATQPATSDELLDALRSVYEHAERNECRHENTHRGGVLWTICDDCERKWSDDQGGFQPYVQPAALAKAKDLLDRLA